MPGLLVDLHAALVAERRRWLLWAPVALGFGIALSFALRQEPPAGVALLILIVSLPAGLWLYGRPRTLGRALALGLVLVAIGFSLSLVRAKLVAAPVIERPATYRLEGRIVLAEPRERGERLTLDRLEIEELSPARTPARVRVTVRERLEDLGPGDRVALLARLQRPSAPLLPGAFDYARRAWFERLGGIGYAYGGVTLLDEARQPEGADIAALRRSIALRVKEVVPGDSGAVAAALLTGLRADIPQHVWRHMQLSGLAHLLAISGLHLGLVGGTVFIVLRYLLPLWPALALRFTVKKLAAAAALFTVFVYLLLAGATIPTQRAFLMVGTGLLAIMLDRNPFSMRLVACAALAILLYQPETLLGPSFQMSFAAVLALVAFYENRPREKAPKEDEPNDDRASDERLRAHGPILAYILGVALTTVIASLATTPFAAFHFQRIATYGVLANLLAVPLTAFWIMPAGLLALITMPLGLDAPALWVMGRGVDLLLLVAAAMADLPGAGLNVPLVAPSMLVAFALGGLWLCLWRGPLRWGAALFWLMALPFALGIQVPNIVIDADARMFAVRAPGEPPAISEGSSFTRDVWTRALGHEQARDLPARGAGRAGGIGCDHVGCAATIRGQTVAIARSGAALAVDCRRADLVIALDGPGRCSTDVPVIDLFAIREAQGLALYIEHGRIREQSVRSGRGERLWVD